jgi:LysR family hydrogen peroxide-inducible transcriptional activator
MGDKNDIAACDLASAPMLMLGEGHCFRDQILASCPMNNPKLSNGNSLETLRFMVANGLGLTLIPAISVPYLINDSLISKSITLHRRDKSWRCGDDVSPVHKLLMF